VPVVITSEQEELALTEAQERLLTAIGEEALRQERSSDAEVSVTMVTDATIQELNRTYRGVDQPTDVLSFALREGDEQPLPAGDWPELLGDVIISLPRAKAQAAEYGHSLERELGYLLVHGILHLLGYDHEDAAGLETMREKEEAVLAVVGLRR
jgi:probable rRNA maturation factor